MKNLLADRPSAQNNSQKAKEKFDQDIINLNREHLSPSIADDWPYHRWAKGSQQTQNTAKNGYQNVPQPPNQAIRQPFWHRSVQETIAAAKWATFSVVAIAIAAMILYEPSSPKRNQQPANPDSSAQTQSSPPLELPTSSSPQETLPPRNITLPELSSQQKGLEKQPLTLNPSQTSQAQPLAVNPSLDKAPSPEPGLSSEPSLSGNEPIIPPTLSLNLPTVEPPCAEQGAHTEASSEAADNNANADENSPIVEVRNYFNKGWQPPAGLKQTLEYSVSLNADGTIQRILPLSNSAGDYIDSTNLPMPGSPFVSPREGEAQTSIQVAFSPDGTVKASLE
jgi:hypothetical protein